MDDNIPYSDVPHHRRRRYIRRWASPVVRVELDPPVRTTREILVDNTLDSTTSAAACLETDSQVGTIENGVTDNNVSDPT